jgi:hypothetical protein
VNRSAPSRFRRIAKWTGLVVCVLIVALWAVSLHWGLCYYVSGGCVLVYGSGFGCVYGDFHLLAGRLELRSVIAGESFVFVLPDVFEYSSQVLALPLWIPLLAVAVSTFILWRRDRPIPPNHCRKRGYDLRAVHGARCPESGTACRVDAGGG